MSLKSTTGATSDDRAAVEPLGFDVATSTLTPFPGPWSVESTEGGHLVVRDADGVALAYVYVQQFGSLNRNGLSSNQALALAESIARIADSDFHLGSTKS